MKDQTSISAWQLDQNGAAAYEQYLVGRFFRRWAERLVAHANAAPGEGVLDAGCGTGIVARTAARHVAPGGRVVGLDLNEGMLEEARRQDADGQVTWRLGRLEEIPFEDGAFDLVLSQQVLQFIPQRDRALAEMNRVLAPGGRLALAVLRDIGFNRSYEALAAALDRHTGAEVGDMMRSPFAGPDAATLREEVRGAGLHDIKIEHHILDVRYPSAAEFLREEAASSPLAEPLSELSDTTLQALIADIETALAPFTDDSGVTFPMETYVVEAHR